MKQEKTSKILPNNYQKFKGFVTRIRYSEYLSDALRSTLAIIIPLTLFIYFNQLSTGISIGIGALFMSLCDVPGNRKDKLNATLVSVLSFAVTSFLISLSLGSPYIIAVFVVILTFIFSMFSVFGNRMSLIGLMGTTMIAFTLGLHPKDPFLFSFYILTGAIWYSAISLTQIYLRPYRSLHHAIFEAIQGTAALMRLRASAYDEEIELRDFNAQNISLHLKLSARQELIRSLLLRDRVAMSPENKAGQRLLAAALDIIDLYEQVTAIHHDYGEIRAALSPTGSLSSIRNIIAQLTRKLESCAVRFSRNKAGDFGELHQNIDEELADLQCLAKVMPANEGLLLNGIAENLKDISILIDRLYSGSFVHDEENSALKDEVYRDFIPETPFSWKNIWRQFSMHSPIFRFALRLSLLCLIASLPTLLFPDQRYSYWLFLTVVIVNRPSFGLTRRRNAQRLWGTLIGLIIGLLLAFTSNEVQLTVAILGLLGFFLFNRTHYLWGVACVTVMVILALNVYHGEVSRIVGDRLLFTLIGCGLSYLSIFIFPIWETTRIKELIFNCLSANRHYLYCAISERKGFLHYSYRTRLARKDAYVNFSFLSEAIQSMRKEPVANSVDVAGLEDIQVLCYQLNGAIAALSLAKADDVPLNNEDFDKCLDDLDLCIDGAESLNLSFLPAKRKNIVNSSKLLSTITDRLTNYFSNH